MIDSDGPNALLDEIRRDLRPVRPLLAPSVRITIVMLVGLVAAALFITLNGLRVDLPAVPPALFAAGIALRFAAGLLLIVIALREAVPSRGIALTVSLIMFMAVALLLVGLPLVAARLAGSVEVWSWSAQIICYRAELLVAAPAFLLTSWLVSRGYPLRPFPAAIAAGAGTGLLADAALFAHCAIDAPAHVLPAHEGAVLTLAVLAAILSAALWRRRMRVNAESSDAV